MHVLYFLVWVNITMLCYFMFHVVDDRWSMAMFLISAVFAFCVVNFLACYDFIFLG